MTQSNLSLAEIEFNDCTVRAISQAFDISYPDAHKICERYGREFRKGFHFQAKLATALRLDPIIDAIGLTVKVAATKFVRPNETYLCLIQGHIFCIKNGRMNEPESILSRKVIRLWKLPVISSK